MASQILLDRINAIIGVLNAQHSGSASMTTPTMGREREIFINQFLGNVITQPFRIGSGDIIDSANTLSHQSDIVIEYSNSLSFPLARGSERLYLAESVCAVIQVKSSVDKQWGKAVEHSQDLYRLVRHPGETIISGNKPPPKKIPMFIVGYKGWTDVKTARANLNAVNNVGGDPVICGILQIDPCFYVSAEPQYKDHSFGDGRGLYGFLISLEQITSGIVGSKPHFLKYMS